MPGEDRSSSGLTEELTRCHAGTEPTGGLGRDAVRRFLETCQQALAPPVTRETSQKLDTGYKNPPRTGSVPLRTV